MKDVVIIANFCMDFSEKDNGRFNYIANKICDKANVELITSDFYHVTKTWRKSIPSTKYTLTCIHEPSYKKNISIKRFFSHHIWGQNVAAYLKKRKKPDVIYCAVPSLTVGNVVATYCKKNNVKMIIDVQDLWPEAFQIILKNSVLSKLVFWPLKLYANRIYASADEICAVSQSYVDRALRVNKKKDYGYAVYLGTSLNSFDNYARNAKPEYEKKANEFVIAYCGTLGSSYDIRCLIDAIAILGNSDLCLLVMGDGPLKSVFEEYAQEKHINVVFLGRLPYDSLCATLCQCDVTVNPIVGTSVASIINKHADYAACGLPVLNTQNSYEYQDLVKKYKMGFNIPAGDPKALAQKISLLYINEKLRNEMGNNARLCAQECFDRDRSYSLIESIILGDLE